MEDLFGLGTSPPVPEPPRKPPRRRLAAVVAAADAPDPAAAAAFALEQRRRLERLADELTEQQRRLATTPPPDAPLTETPTAPSTADVVIERWVTVLSAPTAVAAPLFIPEDSRAGVIPSGPGVAVQLQCPLGTNLAALGQRLSDFAAARGWGEWRWQVVDATRLRVARDVVGEDPVAPWRAAGELAHRVYEAHQSAPGEIGTRRKVFEALGLFTKAPDKTIRLPKILRCEIGPRGPELLVDLPPGLAVSDVVDRRDKLRTIFRCPDLAVVADGVCARIELRTRAAASFPTAVPLDPASLWRPTTPDQTLTVADKLVLPIGVTRDGNHLRVGLAQGRPHSVLAGTSGSGKSRTIQTMIVGLCLQGAHVAVGDFKGDPALSNLYAARLPGFIHLSTSTAGISRLVLWVRDELARRSALTHALARRGVADPVWQPVVVIIDEWGQGLVELLDSTDPAEKAAGEELARAVGKVFAQGRSFGLYMIVSTQHTYAAAFPGKIAQNCATRIVLGRPKAGPRGPIEVLFATEKEEANAAAAGITDGMRGRGIVADPTGQVVQFQSYFGYSPTDRSAAADLTLAASWAATEAALRQTPRPPRFGWRFPAEGPGSDGSWQEWSLYGGTDKAPRPTVAELPVILLDGPDGRPDPEAARWDPLAAEYDPGGAPLADRHCT